jgi:hypothetical protein
MRPFHVRRDRLAAFLPWLWLAWVVVLLVLLWMVTTTTTATLGTPSIAGAGGSSPAHSAVAEFGLFVVERGAAGHGTLERDDIAEGIGKLSAALLDVAGHEGADGTRLRQRIDEVTAAAALLRNTRLHAEHTRIAQNAFARAAEVIAIVQTQRYPHLDRAADETRHAARSIRPDRPLLSQTEGVQRFFERSHDILRAMIG